jgi:hypothetical protein
MKKHGLQIRWPHILTGLIAWGGIIQFGLAVYAAIEAYPGGEYSLRDQFLSDLGCTATDGGHDNSASAALFNRAAIWLGVSLLPFFVVLPKTVLENGLGRDVSIAAAVAFGAGGCLSACGLIGIGLTPYDRYLVTHNAALGLWLLPMLGMSVAWLGMSMDSGKASPWLVMATMFLVVMAMLFVGAGGNTLFQKVVICAAVVWFALLFLQVASATVTVIVSSRARQAERQAVRYMAQLQRGLRRR